MRYRRFTTIQKACSFVHWLLRESGCPPQSLARFDCAVWGAVDRRVGRSRMAPTGYSAINLTIEFAPRDLGLPLVFDVSLFGIRVEYGRPQG